MSGKVVKPARLKEVENTPFEGKLNPNRTPKVRLARSDGSEAATALLVTAGSEPKAVEKAVELMRERGLEYVVDMDQSKCFDLLDHHLILNAVKRRITDGSILALIRMFLESGVMEHGEFTETANR